MKAVCAAFITALKTVREPDACRNSKNEFAPCARSMATTGARVRHRDWLNLRLLTIKRRCGVALLLHRLPDIDHPTWKEL
jgi:hypothetical protein